MQRSDTGKGRRGAAAAGHLVALATCVTAAALNSGKRRKLSFFLSFPLLDLATRVRGRRCCGRRRLVTYLRRFQLRYGRARASSGQAVPDGPSAFDPRLPVLVSSQRWSQLKPLGLERGGESVGQLVTVWADRCNNTTKRHPTAPNTTQRDATRRNAGH